MYTPQNRPGCAADLRSLAQDNVRRGANQLNLGIVNNFLGKFEEAILCFEKAFKLLHSSDSKKFDTNIYNSLGMLYLKTGNYEKSLECYQESLKIAEKKKDRYRMSLNLNGIGVVYEKIGCFELAEKYLYDS